MSKTNKPDKKKAEPVKPPLRRTTEVYKVLLVMGPWKKEFTGEECRLMIAEALNQCSHRYHGDFEVTGYLITGRRLFLALSKKGPSLQDLLTRFYEQLNTDITMFHHHRHLFLNPGIEREHAFSVRPSELFTVHPFLNPNLFKLITGQKVTETYYNPRLERLKDYIHNYNFCSAMDYSGAIGPVIVKLVRHQT